MMGWMAGWPPCGIWVPNCWLIESASEQGAIHGRDYNSRIRFGEAGFPGAWGRRRGSDDCTQAASAGAGSGVLQQATALLGGHGGMCDGSLLGAGAACVGPRGAADASAIRESLCEAQQERCCGCGSDLRGGCTTDDALRTR